MDDILISDFEYSNYEKMQIILENVYKMLQNRKLIKNINDINLNNIYKQLKKSLYYDITLDKEDIDKFKKYKLIVLDETLEKLTSGTDTYKFMNKYQNEHLIFIVDSKIVISE